MYDTEERDRERGRIGTEADSCNSVEQCRKTVNRKQSKDTDIQQQKMNRLNEIKKWIKEQNGYLPTDKWSMAICTCINNYKQNIMIVKIDMINEKTQIRSRLN